jgi:DNA-binding LytR/AlgR family response regulator
MKIRCVIIDDEFLARQYLRDYVGRVPILELAGDFNSPLKALDLLENGAVDLLFLDIHMPDLGGIDFLKTLKRQPYVVLTTAYKEYALEGYELNAADYLLKPFSFERFLKAVNKVAERMAMETRDQAVTPADSRSREPRIREGHLLVRADRKYYKIDYDDLVFIEGQKAYVTFHCRNQKIIALASLKDLEDKLPRDRFIRIHKSFIVSIDDITAMECKSIEIGRRFLPIGKNYRKRVNEVLGLEGSD